MRLNKDGSVEGTPAEIAEYQHLETGRTKPRPGSSGRLCCDRSNISGGIKSDAMIRHLVKPNEPFPAA